MRFLDTAEREVDVVRQSEPPKSVAFLRLPNSRAAKYGFTGFFGT